jgi:hypothetical protein
MCDPVTLGAVALAGVAGAGATAVLGKAPSVKSSPAAPSRTDSDLASAAEEARRRFGLSTKGFGSLYKTQAGVTGPGADTPALKRIVLGA